MRRWSSKWRSNPDPNPNPNPKPNPNPNPTPNPDRDPNPNQVFYMEMVRFGNIKGDKPRLGSIISDS